MLTVTTTLHPAPRTLASSPMLVGRFAEPDRSSLLGKAALYLDRIELRCWSGWRWRREVVALRAIRRVEWHAGTKPGERIAYVMLDGATRMRCLRFDEPMRWERMLDAALRQTPTRSRRVSPLSTLTVA